MNFLTLTTQTTKNIGDEIQIIAANRFLKNETTIGTVDREALSDYAGESARLIMNGWYFHDPTKWPPSSQILPLITSFHLTDLPSEINGENPRETILQPENLPFLQENGPIGARDLEMLEFLRQHKIPSYFSGCLTLTLKKSDVEKDGSICLVDASDELAHHVSKLTRKKIVRLYNSNFEDNLSHEDKIILAQQTLDCYERADLVISERLHAILPSLALETPCILLHNKNKDASRYSGLMELVRNCSHEDFMDGAYNNLIEHPTLNSNHYLSIAKNLELIIERFIKNEPMSYHELIEISEQNLHTLLRSSETNRALQQANKPQAGSKGSLMSLFSKFANHN